MMRDDYINRYAVLNVIDDAIAHNALSYEGCVNAIMEFIAKIPAADVMEVKRGKWEHLTKDEHSQTCSACRKIYYNILDYPFNYCPNCGAMMEES